MARHDPTGRLTTDKDMSKIKITQVRSLIRQNEGQRRTMRALGLRRIHHSVEHEDTPQIQGMIDKIRHLVRIEEA